ncbi:formylglycine-generating enzyme family protein [Candidatus Accumulibacter phosphatis]|nr:formylglycine-generating enzyme family protein [Candidatus Accumulibacter phosphatis]
MPDPQELDRPAPRPPDRTPARAYRAPAPRLRDRILPLLYPLPGGESATARSLLGVAFGLALVLLALAGVVAPFVVPDAVRQWSPASAQSVTDAGQLSPGSIFRDCRDESCPWLVVLPPGRFVMGSAAGEAEPKPDEGPQHEVAIAAKIAVMQHEVTRGQFAAFVKETKYQIKAACSTLTGKGFAVDPKGAWNSVGFTQTDQHPVVCVDWNDARAYALWLSQRTGRNYRLLSEAEWEYAARAGSQTPYAFGDRANEICSYGNVADRSLKDALKELLKGWVFADCSDGNVYTASVKSFKANAFGLYDMLGNAWEWTEDCYHGNYSNAPGDGSAWVDGNCSQRILRGGGWDDDPYKARSANRFGSAPGGRGSGVGFRLARTLP